MTLTRWNPVSGLATIEVDHLNSMFDRVFGDESWSGAWVPAVDIYETAGKDFVVKAELPDMKREDIKVTVEDDVLTIEGERTLKRDEPRDQYHRVERRHGAFRRSFSLPVAVDAGRVSAAYQDGVLTVTLPRRDEAKPRQIQVNG